MKIRCNFKTRFFVMLVVSAIVITSLLPSVYGNSNLKSENLTEIEKKLTQNLQTVF